MKILNFFLLISFFCYTSNLFSQSESKNMKPFKINITQNVLDDLKKRLEKTRWTDEPKNLGWGYGTNPKYLRELVDYWKTKYDWRKQEASMNTFPQFIAEIDGINVHFIYVRGKGKNPKPLILTHGWPDNFYRFHKVIPMLTDPSKFDENPDQSFDIIVPSMPGFAFSDKTAIDPDKVALIWNKLMTEVLNYPSFYAAGGDFGALVTKSLANQFPENVEAIHLTEVGYPNGIEYWSTMSTAEQEFGKSIQKWWYSEGGYNLVQSTKPQTLGYGLNDSPVGLASWIIDRFYSWSDNEGNLENSFTKDELLTNIMIYWVTQTINSSNRMYFESAKISYQGEQKWEQKVTVPTGIALFPKEAQFPIEWAERKVNLKRFTKMKKGGHFAPMEEPKLWVNDITTFFYK